MKKGRISKFGKCVIEEAFDIKYILAAWTTRFEHSSSQLEFQNFSKFKLCIELRKLIY